CLGILLGSAVAALLTGLLSPTEVAAWAWRIPLLFGIAVGLVGLWLRHGIDESPTFRQCQAAGEVARTPFKDAMLRDYPAIVAAMFLTLLMSVGFYLPFVWLSTWLAELNKPPLLDPHLALTANTIAMAVMAVLIPLGGGLSDRFGRKPVLVAGALGY